VTSETGRNNRSDLRDQHIRHLQERVNKAEPEVAKLRERVRELEEALRPFAELYRDGAFGDDAVHTDLVHLYTRETYLARAAELTQERSQK
jgi:hypothetical protein